MLKLKELKNKQHNADRQCVGFEYVVEDTSRHPNDPNRFCFIARWRKGVEPAEWNMQVILGRTRDADSQVYNFGYILPREGLDLVLIAATGLKYFQLYLQQEIQMKSNFDFVLGDLLKDM